MPSTRARTVVSRTRSVIPWRSASAEIHWPATLYGHLVIPASPVPQTVGFAAQGVRAPGRRPSAAGWPRVRAALRIRRAASWWPLRRSHAVPERRRRPGDRSASRRCVGRGRAGSHRAYAEPPATIPAPSGRPFPRRTRRHRPGCSHLSPRPTRAVFQTRLQSADSRFPDGEGHADSRRISGP